MLSLCLEWLYRCPEAKEVEVYVYIDNHTNEPPDPAMLSLAEAFPVKRIVQRLAHSSYFAIENVMEAFREGKNLDLVYLVEGDALISKDFFEWHRACHKRGVAVSTGYSSATNTYGAISSLGLCFHQGALSLVAEHACREYYENPVGYCLIKFPEFGSAYAGFDGMINRVVYKSNLPVAVPENHKVQHIGIYGENRGHWDRLQGTWQEKREEIRAHLNDKAWLCRDFEDCAPVEGVTT